MKVLVTWNDTNKTWGFEDATDYEASGSWTGFASILASCLFYFFVKSRADEWAARIAFEK